MGARLDRHVLVPYYGETDETVRMWVPWSQHPRLANEFVCTGQSFEYDGELLEVWLGPRREVAALAARRRHGLDPHVSQPPAERRRR